MAESKLFSTPQERARAAKDDKIFSTPQERAPDPTPPVEQGIGADPSSPDALGRLTDPEAPEDTRGDLSKATDKFSGEVKTNTGFLQAATSGPAGPGKGNVTVQETGLGAVDPAVPERLGQLGPEVIKRRLQDGAFRMLAAGNEAEEMNALAEITKEDPETARRMFEEGDQRINTIYAGTEALVDSLANGRVDPNRFFHNRSAATGFASALAVAVGQMASIRTGTPNAALRTIENAINRDMRAQEIESVNKISAANVSLQLIDRARSITKDKAAAIQLVRHLRYETALANMRAYQSTLAPGIIKNNVEQAILLTEQRSLQALAQSQKDSLKAVYKGSIKKIQRDRAQFLSASLGGQRTPGAGSISRGAVSGAVKSSGFGKQPVLDANGQVVLDAKGKPKTQIIDPVTRKPVDFHEGNSIGIPGHGTFYVMPGSILRENAKARTEFSAGAAAMSRLRNNLKRIIDLTEGQDAQSKIVSDAFGVDKGAFQDSLFGIIVGDLAQYIKVSTGDQKLTDEDFNRVADRIGAKGPSGLEKIRSFITPESMTDGGIRNTLIRMQTFIGELAKAEQSLYNTNFVLTDELEPVSVPGAPR